MVSSRRSIAETFLAYNRGRRAAMGKSRNRNRRAAPELKAPVAALAEQSRQNRPQLREGHRPG